VTDSIVRAHAQIGPFSHLRPESDIGEEAHVGNFVETKKTRLDRGAKANHLAYLGDGFVGENANVGAGTIFCNYDGFQKQITRIGKNAFIRSDSQLVAPVTIGDGAGVGGVTRWPTGAPGRGASRAAAKLHERVGEARERPPRHREAIATLRERSRRLATTRDQRVARRRSRSVACQRLAWRPPSPARRVADVISTISKLRGGS
jgi:bifunctional UDP-N-acetylglucosamine pyrophosphorylase/glucosamine-1-phosphate N-acetyltransferase